jgi:hypothetical protein
VSLPDDVDAIASEVRALSESVELVITSGGMGPTLDDVTMEGVAKALGKALVRCGTNRFHACIHGGVDEQVGCAEVGQCWVESVMLDFVLLKACAARPFTPFQVGRA